MTINGKYYTDYNTFSEEQLVAKDLAIEEATEGFVMLKNENNVLPLKKNAKVSLGDRALASVAAVSMIVKEEDLNTLIADVTEISETLKSVRGLGNMGVGKNFRNLT